MEIKPEALNAYFSKLGMKLVQDSKNPRLYLIYPPGQPSGLEPAKYILAIPKHEEPGLKSILPLVRLSQKLRHELLIPTSVAPPFSFLQIRKITSW